jgi:hypothetical protein
VSLAQSPGFHGFPDKQSGAKTIEGLKTLIGYALCLQFRWQEEIPRDSSLPKLAEEEEKQILPECWGHSKKSLDLPVRTSGIFGQPKANPALQSRKE